MGLISQVIARQGDGEMSCPTGGMYMVASVDFMKHLLID